MRNLLVVVLGVCLSVLCMQSVGTLALPEEVEDVQAVVGTEGEAGVEAQEMPQIQPRITCDLMSGWVWGERLCAAHCIAKGYRGGWCDSKRVCNCRN